MLLDEHLAEGVRRGADPRQGGGLRVEPVRRHRPQSHLLPADGLAEDDRLLHRLRTAGCADPAADNVHLVLRGEVELLDARTGLRNRESAGAFIGDLDCTAGEKAAVTCRALSHLTVLRIPGQVHVGFLRRAGLLDELRAVHDNRQILRATWLFGEMVSLPIQIRIARAMVKRTVREDSVIMPAGRAEILVLTSGLVSVFLGTQAVENLKPGDFFDHTLPEGRQFSTLLLS